MENPFVDKAESKPKPVKKEAKIVAAKAPVRRSTQIRLNGVLMDIATPKPATPAPLPQVGTLRGVPINPAPLPSGKALGQKPAVNAGESIKNLGKDYRAKPSKNQDAVKNQRRVKSEFDSSEATKFAFDYQDDAPQTEMERRKILNQDARLDSHEAGMREFDRLNPTATGEERDNARSYIISKIGGYTAGDQFDYRADSKGKRVAPRGASARHAAIEYLTLREKGDYATIDKTISTFKKKRAAAEMSKAEMGRPTGTDAFIKEFNDRKGRIQENIESGLGGNYAEKVVANKGSSPVAKTLGRIWAGVATSVGETLLMPGDAAFGDVPVATDQLGDATTGQRAGAISNVAGKALATAATASGVNAGASIIRQGGRANLLRGAARVAYELGPVQIGNPKALQTAGELLATAAKNPGDLAEMAKVSAELGKRGEFKTPGANEKITANAKAIYAAALEGGAKNITMKDATAAARIHYAMDKTAEIGEDGTKFLEDIIYRGVDRDAIPAEMSAPRPVNPNITRRKGAGRPVEASTDPRRKVDPEPLPAVAQPGAKAKEPWQMTVEEHRESLGVAMNDVQGSEKAYSLHKQSVQNAINDGKPVSKATLRQHAGMAPHLLTKSEWAEADRMGYTGFAITAPHRTWVERAVKAGKYVPEDVLADYPDIAARLKEPIATELPAVAQPAMPSIERRKGKGKPVEVTSGPVIRDSRNTPETKPKLDAAYHYTDGNLGMTANGSFTKDKSRWIRFTREDAERMQGSGVRPYGATRTALFTNTDSNAVLKPAKPVEVTSGPVIRDSRNTPEMDSLKAPGAKAVRADVAPTPVKKPAGRFSLTIDMPRDEKLKLLSKRGDAYVDNGNEIIFKGLDRNDEEIYGYEYSPAHFHQSDSTGRGVRHYIPLADGRRVHVSEVFPDLTDNLINILNGERPKMDGSTQAKAELWASKAGHIDNISTTYGDNRTWLRGGYGEGAVFQKPGSKLVVGVSPSSPGWKLQWLKDNGWEVVRQPEHGRTYTERRSAKTYVKLEDPSPTPTSEFLAEFPDYAAAIAGSKNVDAKVKARAQAIVDWKNTEAPKTPESPKADSLKAPEAEAAGQVYTYRLTSRPAGNSTTPGVPGRQITPGTNTLSSSGIVDYGTVSYTRPLTGSELSDFSLVPDIKGVSTPTIRKIAGVVDSVKATHAENMATRNWDSAAVDDIRSRLSQFDAFKEKMSRGERLSDTEQASYRKLWEGFDKGDSALIEDYRQALREVDAFPRVKTPESPRADSLKAPKADAPKAPEVDKAAPKNEPGTKEPWEMTRKEFMTPRSEQPSWKPISSLQKRFGAAGPTPEQLAAYKAEVAARSKSQKIAKAEVERSNQEWRNHRKSVEKALAEGRPVPSEVLADYPDLKAPKADGRKADAPKAKPAPEPVAAKVDTPESAAPIIREAHTKDDVTWDAATEAEFKKGPKKHGMTEKQRNFLKGKIEEIYEDLPDTVESTYQTDRLSNVKTFTGFKDSEGIKIAVPGDGTFTLHSKDHAKSLSKAFGVPIESQPVKVKAWVREAGELIHGDDYSGSGLIIFRGEPKLSEDSKSVKTKNFDAAVKKFSPEEGSPEKTITRRLTEDQKPTNYVDVTLEDGKVVSLNKVFVDEAKRRGFTIRGGDSDAVRLVDANGATQGLIAKLKLGKAGGSLPYVAPKAVKAKPLNQSNNTPNPARGFQPTPTGVKGMYEWDAKAKKGVVTLFENADISTVLHETAHHYLKYMPKGHFEVISKAAGVGKPLDKLSNEEYVQVQEYFARGWETALTKGTVKASSPKEAAVYAYVKKRMNQVYGEAGVPMPDYSVPKSGLNQSNPQTKTSEFKKWFGDSKVVDEKGEPLVVYHGTSSGGHKEFSHAFRGGMGGKLGFWFAADPSALDSFTRQRFASAPGPAVYPTYLSISKLKVYDSWDDFVGAVKAKGKSVVEENMTALRRELKRKGYEGIRVINSSTDGGVVRDDYVAFEPTQIKSAIGNSGKFDPNNPSILSQVPGKGNGNEVDPDVADIFAQMLGGTVDPARIAKVKADIPAAKVENVDSVPEQTYGTSNQAFEESGNISAPEGKGRSAKQLLAGSEVNSHYDALELSRGIGGKQIPYNAANAAKAQKAVALMEKRVNDAAKALKVEPGDPRLLKDFEEAREDLQEFAEGIQVGKSEWSDVGRVLQLRVNEMGDFAKMQESLRTAKKGEPLTAKETKAAQDLADKYNESVAEIERLKKALADASVKRNTPGAPRNQKVVVARKQKAIDFLHKYRDEQGNALFQSADPGDYDLTQAIKDLARGHVADGVDGLDSVVKKITAEFPKLSENQIVEAIAAPSNQTFSDLSRRLLKLKAEARKLAGIKTPRGVRSAATEAEQVKHLEARIKELETKIETGDFSTKSRTAAADTAQVEALKKKRKELNDALAKARMESPEAVQKRYEEQVARATKQLADMEKKIAGGTARVNPKAKAAVTSELKALRDKQAALKRGLQVKDDIAELERRLRDKDFDIPVKEVKAKSLELQRAEAQKQALKRQFEALRRQAQNPTGTAMKIIGETTGALRFATLGADLGALLRQGRYAVTDPKNFAKGVAAMTKSLTSDPEYLRLMEAIRSREIDGVRMESVRKKAGLSLPDSIVEHEEGFINTVLSKLPIGRPLERAQTAFLNTIRANQFDEFYASGEYGPKELESVAQFINSVYGRSNLKSVWKPLNILMTSPRYETSRWETLAAPFKYGAQSLKGNRGAQRNIRVIAGQVSSLIVPLIMADQVLKAKNKNDGVVYSPGSSDFLKIRIDGRVYDMSAGVAPRLRTLLRSAYGLIVAKDVKYLWDTNQKQFISSLSPGLSVPTEVYTGESATGYPSDIKDSNDAWMKLTPLIVQQVKKDWDKKEEASVLTTNLFLNMIGIGVGGYPKSKAKLPAPKILKKQVRATGLGFERK